jgi:hypothetical protein
LLDENRMKYPPQQLKRSLKIFFLVPIVEILSRAFHQISEHALAGLDI